MNNFYILVLLCILPMICYMPQCADAADNRNTTWMCNNQVRIAKEKVCDGRRDCSDASDETALTCFRKTCSVTQYRCAYGACINATAKCDKRTDCADDSDETRFSCIDDTAEMFRQLQGDCSDSEMQCFNGQCIDDMLRCDGKRDCDDGSDETVTMCSNFECPQYAFRCGYGGCIASSKRCNGDSDCVDGTDEFCAWPNLLKSRSLKRTRSRRAATDSLKSCIIPFNRQNLRVTLRDEQSTSGELQAGDTVPKGKTIRFECLYAFGIVGVAELTCESNSWYKQWPKCVATAAQPTCKQSQLRCISGECIDESAICNGSKDCQDASDETVERCIANECKTNEYRCAYGACIANTTVCNGVRDCADGSDELTLLCANKEEVLRELRGNCNESSIQCTSGECIEGEHFCDGLVHCTDASDESFSKCGHMTCPPYAFHCGYGACISFKAACNDIADCHDKSDELPAVCQAVDAREAEQEADDDAEVEYVYVDEYEGMKYLNYNDWIDFLEATTESEPGMPLAVLLSPEHVAALENQCNLPLDHAHLLVKNAATNSSLLASSQVDAATVVQFHCEDGWQLVDGEAEALCMDNGQWTATPPKCEKFCDNFAINRGLSTSAKCYYNQQPISCTLPLRTGSVANIYCANGYRRIESNGIASNASRLLTCDADGEWDYAKFKCTPDCVEPVKYKSEQTIMPYNVNIYKRVLQLNQTITRTFECSGAIIAPKIVITTVICFTKANTPFDPANDPTLYEVVVASNDATYDAQHAHNVSEIVQLHTDIKVNDIPAAVILTNFIIMSPTVKPVCWDFTKYACFEEHMNDENDIELTSNTAFSPKHGAIIAVSNGENRKCLALMGAEGPVALNPFQQLIQNQILRYSYLM